MPKKLFALLLSAVLCACAVASAETYQVIMDDGSDVYQEDGVTLAELTAKFPQIINLPNTAVMDHINRSIQDYIRLEGGYDGVMETALGDYKEKAEWIDFSTDHYFLDVQAEPKLQSDRLFSVFYAFAAYMGGAHPDHWTRVEMYDMASGDLVLLESMVADMDAFHDKVAELLLKKIDETGMAKDQDFFDGFEETVRAWRPEQAVATQEGLLVFFDYYELAPYSSGSQLITLPYDALDPFINETGKALLGR